jgi:mono/diheme cytochrome c family protein
MFNAPKAKFGRRPNLNNGRKGLVMSGNKLGRCMIFGSSILTALIVGLTGFPIPLVNANAAQAGASMASTFKTKCAICHGPDGAGSEVGKSMNVPDLRSQAVQSLADTELVEVITNGKNGMPSFKSSFSTEQIQSLVKYVRTLAKKK